MSVCSSPSAESRPWSEDAPGLYVHVPFCRSLCPYCDFTIALSAPEAHEPLVEALLQEWRTRRSGSERYRTLYLGGGTPTELPAPLLARLVGTLASEAGEPAEITVEANPESATPAKLAALRSMGVTRLSLGVQSLDPGLLATLGRNHDAAAARAAFRAAREAGFDSINVDLMFGLPGQTLETWCATLEEVLRWGPEHLSSYALELSPTVPMARRLAQGRLTGLPEESCEVLYRQLCERAREAGFEHYEVSNFSRPGNRSLHNAGYWEGRPYLGLGPGAHSFDGRSRSWNVRPHREYVRLVRDTAGRAEAGGERLTAAQRRMERVFLSLRTDSGLCFERFGPDAGLLRGSAALWAQRQDPQRVRWDDRALRLSETGFWYSQGLTADFLSALPDDGWAPADEPSGGTLA